MALAGEGPRGPGPPGPRPGAGGKGVDGFLTGARDGVGEVERFLAGTAGSEREGTGLVAEGKDCFK